jgi:hypothetical protein
MLLQVDILAHIFSEAGLVAAILGSGLFVIWGAYQKEKQLNIALNESIRKDALDNIRIIDSLVNVTKSHSDDLDKILDHVTETLAYIKAKNYSKIHDDASSDIGNN